MNSNQYQTFIVAVSAKINGGLESKLESLIGDVGDAVKGGKNNYIVIWDVLKDVDEVNSVDFSVRAELVNDISLQNTNKKPINENTLRWQKKGGHLIAIARFPGPYWGIRIGYMGNWGFSIQATYGLQALSSDYSYLSTDILDESKGVSLSLDITKRLYSRNATQVQSLIGFSLSNLEYVNVDIGGIDSYDKPGLELGATIMVKRFAGIITMTKYFVSETEIVSSGGDIRTLVTPTFFINVGIGFRF